MTLLVVAVCLGIGTYRVVSRPSPGAYQPQMDGGRYDHKQLGIILKKVLPPGAIIMTRSGRIAFYSGHPYVDIPQADLQTILRTAREQKVRYLIVSGELEVVRPQVAMLLQPLFRALPGIYVATTVEEVLPGLVRRLTYDDPTSQGMVVYEFIR